MFLSTAPRIKVIHKETGDLCSRDRTVSRSLPQYLAVSRSISQYLAVSRSLAIFRLFLPFFPPCTNEIEGWYKSSGYLSRTTTPSSTHQFGHGVDIKFA